ncbi:MAG TPA: endospore germination permease [Bacillota bacterium]|nr:endospore germination permease [Bacillota bacterium]
MIKEGKFGVQEAVCLTTIAISTKIFFTSPGFLTRYVGNAGWYMTLISNMTAIAVFALICLLLKRFPGKSITEIFDLAMGRVLGFIFSLILTLAFVYSAGVIVREFADVSKTFTLPASPISMIIGGLVLVVLVAAFLGLETIARAAKLFGYVLLFMYISVLVLAAQHYEPGNLFPILGFGLDQTVIHGLKRSAAYEEVVILAVFAGSLQGVNHIRRAGFISLILSGLIISGGLLCFSLAFPVFTNQEVTSPMYILTRIIRYGTFFQRLDPIFLLLWTSATFITVSALFYASVSTYCKTFRLQDPRPVVIPMLVILFGFAIMPRDFATVVEGAVEGAREYGWVVFYGLHLFTLLVAVIRKKRGDQADA